MLLQRALDANAHLKHSTFFQLVRLDRLYSSPFRGNRNILTIDRFRPRWAAAEGQQTAPSFSGNREAQFCALTLHFLSILIRIFFRTPNLLFFVRGFQEHCDKLQINTDARSNKVCCYSCACKFRMYYCSVCCCSLIASYVSMCEF